MGTDDEGNVVFGQAIALVHPKSLAKSGCVSELFRLSVIESELVAKLLHRSEEKSGKKLGVKIIIDLDGFNMDLLYTPTLMIYKELLTLLQVIPYVFKKHEFRLNSPMSPERCLLLTAP